MAKFHGVVGYGVSEEVSRGVWVNKIVERSYFGDITRNHRKLQERENLNPDILVQNHISIIADAYAYDHFFAIKYANWSGVLWIVSDITVERPRLILRLGGVYNGPVAGDDSSDPVPDDPGDSSGE